MADEGLTVDIGDFFPTSDESILDQLTQVRNYVRKQFTMHDDAEMIQVSVAWQTGDVDDLVFDKQVGYPQGTDEKFWFKRWTSELHM